MKRILTGVVSPLHHTFRACHTFRKLKSHRVFFILYSRIIPRFDICSRAHNFKDISIQAFLGFRGAIVVVGTKFELEISPMVGCDFYGNWYLGIDYVLS